MSPAEPEEGEQDPAEVFDCGVLEVSCHITSWFHGLVSEVVNPLFGWMAAKAFHTPEPTPGVTGVWEGVSAAVNTVYALLILAAGLVIMAHHSLQAQYGARELLPRLVVGFVASNLSLVVVRLMSDWSSEFARAFAADGVSAERAARALTERMGPFLLEATAFVVLLLLVLVVLLVVWSLVEIARIVIVILLTVGAPLMLMFHALPQTNRIAELWWRAMTAVCLIPIAQALAFVALMRVFFEGDTQVLFGAVQILSGDANLFDLFLLLVLVYVQIRIPFWTYRAVLSGQRGRSPVVSVAKSLTWAAALTTAAFATGGTAAAGTAASGAVRGRLGSLLRTAHNARTVRQAGAVHQPAAMPRRVRTWRFGTPNASTPPTRHGSVAPLSAPTGAGERSGSGRTPPAGPGPRTSAPRPPGHRPDGRSAPRAGAKAPWTEWTDQDQPYNRTPPRTGPRGPNPPHRPHRTPAPAPGTNPPWTDHTRPVGRTPPRTAPHADTPRHHLRPSPHQAGSSVPHERARARPEPRRWPLRPRGAGAHRRGPRWRWRWNPWRT
ncbi:hypothetical protein [Nocardiopsis deserti]|uniref:hypothetical protein n=1 Tax=Nocardiopsis deserti TaxID=2605988 RepID=UPI00123B88C5|nr:hypothetical protein [Nocardiopsis deserti]